MSEIGYLGLGSNVGDRRMNLQATVELLWAHDVIVLLSSSRLRDRARGRGARAARVLQRVPAGGDAAEAGARCWTRARRSSARSGASQAGEDGYVKDGPRAIDVDLLLLGDAEYSSERLTLPHREVTSRRFVLVPLLEL